MKGLQKQCRALLCPKNICCKVSYGLAEGKKSLLTAKWICPIHAEPVQFFVGKNHPFMPWWNKYPGQLARLTLAIHIIRWKSGEADNLVIDAVSLKKGVLLGKFFLANAYQTVVNRNRNNNQLMNMPHQKEYAKIARWVTRHKEPMSLRTMLQNRCFGSAEEAQIILNECLEDGLVISVDEDKKLFVPVGLGE